jgi:hypothetical protein
MTPREKELGRASTTRAAHSADIGSAAHGTGTPLDYAPRDESIQAIDDDPAVRAQQRLATFRKIRLILRVIYLVVCLALLVFAWRYIQQYITLLDNAGR